LLRYNISTVILLLIAFLVQQFVPAFTGLSHARFLIVHLVFLCCAVTVTTPTMLLLAFIGGLLWDAHCYLAPIVADPEVYSQPVESLRFGYSIILFGIAGFLMQGLNPVFRQGKWHFSALLSGIAIFLYLTAEFLVISFIRGDFTITRSIFRLLIYTSVLTMIISPIVFWLLYQIAKIFDYSLYPEARKSNSWH
jgi:cell shape-determining protein MreD